MTSPLEFTQPFPKAQPGSLSNLTMSVDLPPLVFNESLQNTLLGSRSLGSAPKATAVRTKSSRRIQEPHLKKLSDWLQTCNQPISSYLEGSTPGSTPGDHSTVSHVHPEAWVSPLCPPTTTSTLISIPETMLMGASPNPFVSHFFLNQHKRIQPPSWAFLG